MPVVTWTTDPRVRLTAQLERSSSTGPAGLLEIVLRVSDESRLGETAQI